MKVLFTKPVPPNKPGDIAEVAEGYARNFLFPRKLAEPATASHLATHAAKVQREQQVKAKAAQQAEAVLQLLQGKTFALSAKANAQGTLYATLTPKHIAAELAKQCGMPMPKAVLEQLPTIKSTGTFTVTCTTTNPHLSFILTV